MAAGYIVYDQDENVLTIHKVKVTAERELCAYMVAADEGISLMNAWKSLGDHTAGDIREAIDSLRSKSENASWHYGNCFAVVCYKIIE